MPNIFNFCIRTEADTLPYHNFTATPSSSKTAILLCYKHFPSFTKSVDKLETFQAFESSIGATAIALHASDLDISQLHFQAKRLSRIFSLVSLFALDWTVCNGNNLTSNKHQTSQCSNGCKRKDVGQKAFEMWLESNTEGGEV